MTDALNEHVSTSQLTMFGRCARQYCFRYVEHKIRPPAVVMLVGGGTHQGAETAMKYKVATGENQRPDDVRDAAVAAFDSRLGEDDVALDDEERSRGRVAVIGEARDRVAAAAHFWACLAQPNYWPLSVESVEQRFRMPLQGGLDLVGVVDLVTREQAVVDWKVGRRAIPQGEADTSIQLTAYALHHEYATGHAPAEVQLAVIQEAKETKHYVRRSIRNRTDYRILLRRVELLQQAKAAGIFPPCNPDNWWCSPRFCGYWRECPYVNNERLARAAAQA